MYIHSMYVGICMYVYINVCINVYMHVYSLYVHICICVCTQSCMTVQCMSVCTYVTVYISKYRYYICVSFIWSFQLIKSTTVMCMCLFTYMDIICL